MKQVLLPVFFVLTLGGGAVLAQTAPRVLSSPPVAPAPEAAPATATVPVTAAAATTAVAADPFLLGRTYRVETMQGTIFTGMLVSMSLTSLEFDAKELGHLTLERGQIRRADLQGALPPTTKAGYYDIGNGNRLFFAPTGRGLRKGEGTLQDVDVYFLGLNYGITDNFSVGGYLSVVPGLDISDQLLVFTPKLSFPVSEKVSFGAGLLYLRVPNNNSSVGAGIGYGALTYGSADNNLTVGLGYGFVQGSIGNTPILQVGGQTRVSRRISLISENYIIADSQAGMAGLYGLKFNWRRTSLGVAGGYLYLFNREPDPYSYNSLNQQNFYTSYIVPVYVDFTFRFGKNVKR